MQDCFDTHLVVSGGILIPPNPQIIFLFVHQSQTTSCPFVSSTDPKAETRLYVTVNGFEFHVYNRTDLYARLQETFGLEATLLTPKKDEERGQEDRNETLEK